MDFLYELLNQGWVGTTIGILGILIALYTYKSSKIGPRLVYQWESTKIIGRNEITPEDITIYYRGIKVPRIIKTTIVIWNSGTMIIDGKNIVGNDPLRLEVSEKEEIIRASILKRTKEVNQFKIIFDIEKSNILYLDFEYFDPQDGVNIEILHTDAKKYPEFKGSIKGMPRGAINWGKGSVNDSFVSKLLSIYNPITLVRSKTFLWTMLIVGISLSGFSIVIPNYFEEFAKKIVEADHNSKGSIFVLTFILGAIYSMLPLQIFWVNRKRYPKSLDVEKLDGDNNIKKKKFTLQKKVKREF